MNNDSGVAILRIGMAENIPAFILKEIVGLVDETYFMHLYLDRAAESPGVFSDYYAPTDEEMLFINRLEIGTPNFIEFVGLIDPLLEAFKWLGGLAGISLATKQTLEHVKTYWEIRELKAKVKKAEAELKKAEVEGRVEKTEILVGEESADPFQRALSMKHKLSPSALDHKKDFSESTKGKVQLVQSFIYPPTIVIFESKKGEKNTIPFGTFIG